MLPIFLVSVNELRKPQSQHAKRDMDRVLPLDRRPGNNLPTSYPILEFFPAVCKNPPMTGGMGLSGQTETDEDRTGFERCVFENPAIDYRAHDRRKDDAAQKMVDRERDLTDERRHESLLRKDGAEQNSGYGIVGDDTDHSESDIVSDPTFPIPEKSG